MFGASYGERRLEFGQTVCTVAFTSRNCESLAFVSLDLVAGWPSNSRPNFNFSHFLTVALFLPTVVLRYCLAAWPIVFTTKGLGFALGSLGFILGISKASLSLSSFFCHTCSSHLTLGLLFSSNVGAVLECLISYLTTAVFCNFPRLDFSLNLSLSLSLSPVSQLTITETLREHQALESLPWGRPIFSAYL